MQINAITPDSIICQSEGKISTKIDDQTVLLSIDQGNYYGMNKVLTSIWQWVEQPTRVSDIFRKLAETYEVSDETCQKDVLKVLMNLQKENLIHIQTHQHINN
nr:lasso peptide biosynthesis PqqD family chaperone [uncultured Rhodoferax sp.]